MISSHTIKTGHHTSLTYFRGESYDETTTADRRPLILLLHGMGSNHTRWLEFTSQTTLTQHWNIIAPDLGGHGRSMTRGSHTMAYWVDDLVAILNAEGYPHAIIAGHSLGAHVALFFAQQHPKMTRGLILVDPLSHNSLSPALKWFRRLRVIGYSMIYLIRLLNRLGLKRRQIPYRSLADLDNTARQLIKQGKTKKMVALYSSIWTDLTFNATCNYLQFIYQVLRPLPELASNHPPTLLLLSKGSVFSDNNQPHKLLQQLQNHTVNLIECNHWLLTEKPVAARETIESWINKEFGERAKTTR